MIFVENSRFKVSQITGIYPKLLNFKFCGNPGSGSLHGFLQLTLHSLSILKNKN